MTFRSITTWLTLMLSIALGQAATYRPQQFGARADGQHIDSPAINAAIQRAADDGGGTVHFSPGTYLCYSIHLRSRVTLHLDSGAVIKAAPVTATQGYDEAEPNDSRFQDFGHSHWHNSLLWGENLHHVTLQGKGLIDGTGVLTRGNGQQGPGGQTTANKALALRGCRNVRLSGLSFLNCGHFAMLLTGVDYLHIEGITADTNRDGIDIDCCEHVTVRGCRVNTINDDAIVLKCSYALGWAKPTQHVLIEDCHVSGYDVGSLLSGTRTTHTATAPDGDGPTGRIKLGTESNGGFRHITIRRCTFTHCRGLALETVDGAPMEDIRASHLTMTDICNAPIYIRLGDRMRAPAGFRFSSARNISIKHVRVSQADSRYACIIAGVEGHPVRRVSIEDVSIQYRGGITLADVREQRGSNPFFFAPARPDGRRGEKNYPEPSAHGLQPAWGFAITHAEDIRLRDVHLEALRHDERPWLHQEATKNVRLTNVTHHVNPDTLTVSQDGTGQYSTIGQAIEACRAFMDSRKVIFIRNGTYREKLVIPQWLQNVELCGQDAEHTIITFADHANMPRPGTSQPMGTFRTYTLKIEGNGITLRNLTVRNDAPQLGQAVALHTEGDRLTFVNCRFIGHQDTIYTGGPGTRLYFGQCFICGTTDFIFGPATAWFEDCTLQSLKNSYITAASTPQEQPFGYIFSHCRLTAAEGVSRVYLGRPWRDYGYTLFMHCHLGPHIRPEGWHHWEPHREQTARYCEYHNHGEGADTQQRVAWSRQLTPQEATRITPEHVFGMSSKWLPTGNPL